MSFKPCGLHSLSEIKWQPETNDAHYAEIKSKGMDRWERVHNIMKEHIAYIRLCHNRVSGFALHHQ